MALLLLFATESYKGATVNGCGADAGPAELVRFRAPKQKADLESDGIEAGPCMRRLGAERLFDPEQILIILLDLNRARDRCYPFGFARDRDGLVRVFLCPDVPAQNYRAFGVGVDSDA